MEFRDLKKQYKVLKNDIDTQVMKVMSEANFISGNQVKELEDSLADYVGIKHCITCANGTDALVLALKAWGIKEGDAVFVPDFTFFASGEAVSACGATPVFVDVETDTFNISTKALEDAVKNVLEQGEYTPKVIIAVDLFGQPADYINIRKIADKYNLLILEDGAQGFGGTIDNKKACSFGDVSTTSFFPAKPLGCYGDGGAIFTDNDEWAELIRSLCVHGKGASKYDNIRIGTNSRLDTIQAAVLKVKLKAFADYELKAVNDIAGMYNEALKNIERIKLPLVNDGFYSSWAQYTIVFDDSDKRTQVQEQLKAKGIPSMIYYAKGMHEQKAFKQKILIGDYNNTDYLKSRVLSLPMHPYMTELDVEQVNVVIKKCMKG